MQLRYTISILTETHHICSLFLFVAMNGFR